MTQTALAVKGNRRPKLPNLYNLYSTAEPPTTDCVDMSTVIFPRRTRKIGARWAPRTIGSRGWGGSVPSLWGQGHAKSACQV